MAGPGAVWPPPNTAVGPKEAVREDSVEGSVASLWPGITSSAAGGTTKWAQVQGEGTRAWPRDERRAAVTVWRVWEMDAEDQLPSGKCSLLRGASGEWVKVNTYQ